MLAVLLTAILAQTPFTFRSSGGVLAVDATARCRLLAAADATELHDGAFVPIAEADTGGTRHAATRFRVDGDAYHLSFGSSGVEATLAIEPQPEGVVFRVLALTGPEVKSLRFLNLSTRGLPNRGRTLNVRASERHAVCVLGLSPRVHAEPWGGHGLGATVYPEFGMVGEGAVLVVAPRDGLLEAVRRAELAFKLPSPTLGGEWAKTSKASKSSYLFTDLTADNVEDTIRYAKLGGFTTILVYSGTWSSSNGTYGIHPKHYPGGEAQLQRVVARCRAAGLQVGLHVLTSMIAKHDPLARPPDPRLLSDMAATLAQGVGPTDTTLTVREPVDRFPGDAAHYGNTPGGTELRIGSEVVKYTGVDRDGRRLTGCTRGWAGTKAQSHAVGTRVEHLAERYNSYLADLRTSLLPQIANRLAGVINRCGIEMVYFDGGENSSANGAYWYWVGRLQEQVLTQVQGELVVQGSGMTHWTWHFFTRGTCDDYAALAPAAFLDTHKIAHSFAEYRRDFLAAELGWWGLLSQDPAWPATTLADVDAYGARMVALDSGVSVETTLADLRRNPQTDALLIRLAQWDALRSDPSVSKAVREALLRDTWSLPGPTRVHRDSRLLEGDAVAFTNPFAAQSPTIVLEALPTLAPAPKPLLSEPTPVPPPPAGAPMPGWLASRTAAPADLSSSRALQAVIEVAPEADGAVLNVQLEAQGLVFRDHLLDLRPGRHTYTLAEPSAERMLREFQPAHANYAFKAAVYAFDYRAVKAVNLRWMKAPAAGRVTVLSVTPLREVPTPLVRPVLRLGDTEFAIPTNLSVGETWTIQPDGTGTLRDAHGQRRGAMHRYATKRLHNGPVQARLHAFSPARIKLTLEFLDVDQTPAP